MASTPRDQNRIPVWWGVSSVDGTTLTPIYIGPGNGKVLFEYGSSTMPVMSTLKVSFPRDENRIPCLGGVSSSDRITIIPVSVNPSTGAIQAQLT